MNDEIRSEDKTNQWRDETLMRSLYLDEHLSSREIAERFGCSKTTVLKWLDRHGVDKQPYDDGDLLHELYWEQRMSTTEIAERFGLTPRGVQVVMDRHGVGLRDGSEAQTLRKLKQPPHFGIDYNGYEVIQTKLRGETYRIYHHRLLAIAEFGVEAVAEHVVHHRNGIRWDNRPDNLELLTAAEHMRRHHERGDFGDYEWLKGGDADE